MKLFFKILWIVDAMLALVVVYFFFIGLGDGTVSANNMLLWVLILAVLAAILLGSNWLRTHQHPLLAIVSLLIPAIPAVLYFIFILIMIFGNGKWN